MLQNCCIWSKTLFVSLLTFQALFNCVIHHIQTACENVWFQLILSWNKIQSIQAIINKIDPNFFDKILGVLFKIWNSIFPSGNRNRLLAITIKKLNHWKLLMKDCVKYPVYCIIYYISIFFSPCFIFNYS